MAILNDTYINGNLNVSNLANIASTLTVGGGGSFGDSVRTRGLDNSGYNFYTGTLSITYSDEINAYGSGKNVWIGSRSPTAYVDIGMANVNTPPLRIHGTTTHDQSVTINSSCYVGSTFEATGLSRFYVYTPSHSDGTSGERWFKIAQVWGYFSFKLTISGGWNWGSPTIGEFFIENRNGGVYITQISGIGGDHPNIIRLGRVETDRWDILVHYGAAGGTCSQINYWFEGYFGGYTQYSPASTASADYGAFTDMYPTTIATGYNITSGNIGSQSCNYANSAGSATDSSKMPLDGGTFTGHVVYTTYSTTFQANYSPIEITSYGNSSSGDYTKAPRIGFHWPNNFWCNLSCESDYSFTFRDGWSPGTFLDLRARNVYANSDKRAKTNFKKPELNCLEIIDSLRFLEYNFKVQNNKEDKYFGLIAQDVRKLLPEKYRNTIVTEDSSKEKNLAINEGKIQYITMGAVQQLSKENTKKDKKISKLESEIKDLKKELKEIKKLLNKMIK